MAKQKIRKLFAGQKRATVTKQTREGSVNMKLYKTEKEQCTVMLLKIKFEVSSNFKLWINGH